MNINDFKEIMNSNVNVNASMGSFSEKLQTIQKEIQRIETMKQMI